MGKKLGIIKFKGASGRFYLFNVYSLDASFNNIGAVYVFSKRAKTKEGADHDILYIGQTGELADRLDNHEKLDCLKDKGVNCICTHVDSNEDSRFKKEADLIREQKPPCNK
jgi:hypothetical protein